MYAFNLQLPTDDYLNDLQDIPRSFIPYIEIDNNAENTLKCEYHYHNGTFSCLISSNIWGDYTDSLAIERKNDLLYKKLTKRLLKNSLYTYLSKNLGVNLPYGSLTGVRPTKLLRELSLVTNNAVEYLIDNFSVTQNRALLISKCVKNQESYINTDEKSVGLFLNIPFCPSRCNYCSFISTEVYRIKKELPKYIECVEADIINAKEIVQVKDYNVSSIYVGGGTPSSIGSEMLNTLLAPLSNYGKEFTVEIGRPDTIDKELLDTLKKNNVTRISINPQTFHQKTLDNIGRRHTVEEIYHSFHLAKSYGFDINMDLIAMLPNESYEDFCYSLDQAISLSPENITIHTLSLKRGSVLSMEGGKKSSSGLADDMVTYAYDILEKNKYLPYYMYRQKNMSDNLENVGFCKEGKQCKYNIDMMEESASIIGMGCGAMSKRITDSKIKRFSSPKGFNEYLERIQKTLENKRDFYLI